MKSPVSELSVPATLNESQVLFTIADALKPPPPRQWCVEGLLPRPGFTLLIGDPGSKKTLTLIDLAVCVAMGKPWLDHPVTQCPVLFVDEQAGPHQLLARFNAALTAHGAPPETPLHIFSLAGHNLRSPESADALIKFVQSKQVGLVIVDAFSNLLRGGSESSLAAVLPVLFHLRRLADFSNAAVIATHHTNRHGHFHGSSAIAVAADLLLSIRSKAAESTIDVAPMKSRFLPPEPFSARINFESLNGVEQVSLARLAKSPVAAGTPEVDPYLIIPPFPKGVKGEAFLIYQDIYFHPNTSFTEIRSRKLSFREGTLRNCIQQLLDEGVAVRSNEGSHGKEARYSIRLP